MLSRNLLSFLDEQSCYSASIPGGGGRPLGWTRPRRHLTTVQSLGFRVFNTLAVGALSALYPPPTPQPTLPYTEFHGSRWYYCTNP